MSEINKWYSGKSVLITGATGFIGKVLVEKIIRGCDEIKFAYLIIRPKKSKKFEERCKEYLNHVVFETIRSTNSKLLAKIKFIEGDLLSNGLGLKQNDLDELSKNVTVIFHNGANVSFDLTLRGAIESNVKGTFRLLELAKKFDHIDVFVYVSTAYSQGKLKFTAEKCYKAPIDPFDMTKILEKYDDDTMNILTAKILKGSPNTYTFSKSLSEDIVCKYKNEFPICIVRPSIVAGSLVDPFPGFIEGYNGFAGFGIGTGHGVIMSCHVNPKFKVFYVPADTVVNTTIAASWIQGNSRSKEISVYNATISYENSWASLRGLKLIQKLLYIFPFNRMLWIPACSFTSCTYYHWTRVFFLQILPAMLLDGLFFIIKQQFIFVRIQRKIKNMLHVLIPFLEFQYHFDTRNFDSLSEKLNYHDRTLYNTNIRKFDMLHFLSVNVLGVKRFILKEKMEDIKYARKRAYVLFILNEFLKVFCIYALVKYLWNYLSLCFK